MIGLDLGEYLKLKIGGIAVTFVPFYWSTPLFFFPGASTTTTRSTSTGEISVSINIIGAVEGGEGEASGESIGTGRVVQRLWLLLRLRQLGVGVVLVVLILLISRSSDMIFSKLLSWIEQILPFSFLLLLFFIPLHLQGNYYFFLSNVSISCLNQPLFPLLYIAHNSAFCFYLFQPIQPNQ